jgi:hypothetical protein
MPRQHHDIAYAKTGSYVLTPFSMAYTTSISGHHRPLIEFLRMTMVHVFPSNPALLRAAREALDLLGGFLRHNLGR